MLHHIFKVAYCKAKVPNRFRQAGYQAIDRICDYYNSLQERTVVPNVKPGYLRNHIPGKRPFIHCSLKTFEQTNLCSMPSRRR